MDFGRIWYWGCILKVGCARAEAANLVAVEAKVQSQDFWWVE